MRRISRKLKRSTKQYIMVCVIAIIICGAAAAVISIKIIQDVRADSEGLISQYQVEMDANKKSVYILNNEVLAGEIISSTNLTRKTVYASQPPEMYIDQNDIGKVALIDLKGGTQVLKSMVTAITVTNDVREAEFNTILVSSNIISNDIIDVRIVYPNGEDYTVLAKKAIKGYAPGAINCFLWLTEEELIRMQSAIVDAYLYNGSYLYTTKYIEPNLQDATIVNYEPSVEAINLIQENPNILETASNELSILVRKALENRLSTSMSKDIRTNQWELENDFIYQNYSNTDEEILNENTTKENGKISKELGNNQKDKVEDIKKDGISQSSNVSDNNGSKKEDNNISTVIDNKEKPIIVDEVTKENIHTVFPELGHQDEIDKEGQV